MLHIAWVRRQRAGANPRGPPLLDLWLLCWSMASGVVRCLVVRCVIDAIFGHRWCVVLLKRYLGIVWGPGYPREQVGALRPPIVSKGRPGRPSSNPRINLGQPS